MPLISLKCASYCFFSLFVVISDIVNFHVFSHSIKDGTVIVVTSKQVGDPLLCDNVLKYCIEVCSNCENFIFVKFVD